MPPRLPAQLRLHGRQGAILNPYTRAQQRQSTCCFCLFSDSRRQQAARYPTRPPLARSRRFQTTIATTPVDVKQDPRKELESVLLDLEKHAPNHVNLSRLQLAVNGLRQRPGDESIRVAILGLTDGASPPNTARDILKLLLADPLREAEAWEREIDRRDLTEPIMIRIGAETHRTESAISLAKGNLLREIHVSSATLDGHNLEILLAPTRHSLPAAENGATQGSDEEVLVPTVDIPTSNDGRHTPIATPVHKAIVVADGIRGAASVLTMPASESSKVLQYAINMPEFRPAETSGLPFVPIDASIAGVGLSLVRKNIGNAIEFEHLWFQSNVPKLVEWLKDDILTTPNNVTKPPVRELIASLLRKTSASIRADQRKLLGFSAPFSDPQTSLPSLERGLAEWAENAHSELQVQLDVAFSSRRWRKLKWWKLFWRVDDVSMLTSDILAQKFLPHAERSSVFLAGRMREAEVDLVKLPPVSGYPRTTAIAEDQPSDEVSDPEPVEVQRQETLWPMDIPNTRKYLQTETVPALQALAQKLVLQTLSTSGLTTSLGALVYIGTLSTTLYEAGAVAALGIVWSMRRMQKQWETAREFWEGEVREEGRKAVRGIEETIASSLLESRGGRQQRDAADTHEHLKQANDLITRAESLLKELK
ncbi:hypothetical protein F5Y08DRAFT_163971 [Xylaria arbuscula]|nr:hypothetical protein F5Y08DRAFT_163971 [Xylaria arbuscula]